MGDLRAEVEVKMTLYGKKYAAKWDWINWTDNGDGIDRRVLEFFQEATDDAKGRLSDHIYEAEQEASKGAREAAERSELARLKAKYDTPISAALKEKE